MKRALAIGGIALLLAAIAAALIPMWTMSFDLGMSFHGYAAVALMIFFSFAVGGGLMFLVFYSARHGYDDEAHHGQADSDNEAGRS